MALNILQTIDNFAGSIFMPKITFLQTDADSLNKAFRIFMPCSVSCTDGNDRANQSDLPKPLHKQLSDRPRIRQPLAERSSHRTGEFTLKDLLYFGSISGFPGAKNQNPSQASRNRRLESGAWTAENF